MNGHSVCWQYAAIDLGIPENKAGENWPQHFNAYDLAQLQEPDNDKKREALRRSINKREGLSIERKPTARDRDRRLKRVGKPDDWVIISDLMISASILYPDSRHNGGNIIEEVYDALNFQAFLDSINEKPSDHIKAWFDAILNGNNGNTDKLPTALIKSTESFNRNQIKRIFNKLTEEQWRGIFNRENKNVFGVARTGQKGYPLYDLEKVSDWLKTNRPGHYTEAEIKKAIQEYKQPMPSNQTEGKATKKQKGDKDLSKELLATITKCSRN